MVFKGTELWLMHLFSSDLVSEAVLSTFNLIDLIVPFRFISDNGLVCPITTVMPVLHGYCCHLTSSVVFPWSSMASFSSADGVWLLLGLPPSFSMLCSGPFVSARGSGEPVTPPTDRGSKTISGALKIQKFQESAFLPPAQKAYFVWKHRFSVNCVVSV